MYNAAPRLPSYGATSASMTYQTNAWSIYELLTLMSALFALLRDLSTLKTLPCARYHKQRESLPRAPSSIVSIETSASHIEVLHVPETAKKGERRTSLAT